MIATATAWLRRWAGAPYRRTDTALALLWMALIFWLSAIPGKPYHGQPGVYSLMQAMSPDVQNLMHLPAFGLGGLLWRRALAARIAGPRMASAGALAVVAAYGVFDEWHQSFVPHRYASAMDVLFDVLGAAVGLWLYSRWTRD